MSYKKASLLVLSLLMFGGLAAMYIAYQVEDFVAVKSFVLGSKFYPMTLSGLISFFSALAVAETLRKEDKKIPLPNMKNCFIVLGIVVAWVFVWTKYRIFYWASCAAVGLMLYIFSPEPFGKKKIITTLVADAAIVLFFFVCFKLLLEIRL